MCSKANSWDENDSWTLLSAWTIFSFKLRFADLHTSAEADICESNNLESVKGDVVNDVNNHQ